MNTIEQRLQTLLREQMAENVDMAMQIHTERGRAALWQVVAIVGWLMAFGVMVLV